MMNSSPEGEDLHPQKSEEDLEYEDRQREYEAAMEKKDDPFQFEDKFQAWLKSRLTKVLRWILDSEIAVMLKESPEIYKVDVGILVRLRDGKIVEVSRWLKSIGFIDLEVIDGHVVQFLPAEVRIHKVDLQGIIDVPFDDGGPGSYGDEPVPF